MIGALLGWQLAPVLAGVDGPKGERLRLAGWEASGRWKALVVQAKEAWRIANARYDLSGRWARFDAPRRWGTFDKRFDVTGRAVRFGDRSGLTAWGRRGEQKLQVWLHGQVAEQEARQAAKSP